MNRKDFLKTIGTGSVVLCANPVKLISETKPLNDVLIEIELYSGRIIEINNRSSYLKGMNCVYDGLLIDLYDELIMSLIDMKDILVESKHPVASYLENETKKDIVYKISRCNYETRHDDMDSINIINVKVNGKTIISHSGFAKYEIPMRTIQLI